MKSFKTLFGKMFSLYIIIVLISFVILAIVVSNTLESYFLDQKEQKLIEQCEKVQRQVTISQKTGFINEERLSFEIDALEKYLNAKIWMVDNKGAIYISSSEEETFKINRKMVEDDIDKVFEGYIIKRHGEFNKQLNEVVLTIAYPIVYKQKVVMALFMHASMPEIKKTIYDINKIVIGVLAFALVIGFIVAFFISAKLKRKIYKMSDVSKRLAKGNFGEIIKIDGTDELSQLAESLNYMSSELSKVDKIRRDFISNLSHDLRSPLTSIKGYAQALMDGTIENDNQEKYLKIILEESDRLSKMTNDILDLSRVESGKYPLDKGVFGINELLINELEKFETKLIDKNIDVKIKLCDTNDDVVADKEKIKRVVYNLMDNAVKFIEYEGQLSIITISEEKSIVISIKNTGECIPQEEIDYIWERFVKLDKSRGKNKRGSGLGLPIVKSILKSHGEKINVKSDKTGTVFIFNLPKSL